MVEGFVLLMYMIFLTCFRVKIECALFGSYAEDLNSFMSSGPVQNPVVIIQLAKVKIFKGLLNKIEVIIFSMFKCNSPIVILVCLYLILFRIGKATLQNAINCTKVLFNPSCDEATEFKKRYECVTLEKSVY